LLLLLLVLGKWSALASLPLGVVAFVVVSGVVGLGVGYTLSLFGLESVGFSLAVPLAATYPLFSLLWTSFMLG
jgi:drug/metabolite transporter (DMT)-like permease